MLGRQLYCAQIRPMKHSRVYGLGQKKLVSGSDPLRATCLEEVPREKQTFLSRRRYVCWKEWIVDFNLDIPLLSNSTVFPSFPLLRSTLCVLPRVVYSCLISTSGSGPLLGSLTMWPWNCLFTSGASLYSPTSLPNPLLKARGYLVFVHVSPVHDTGLAQTGSSINTSWNNSDMNEWQYKCSKLMSPAHVIFALDHLSNALRAEGSISLNNKHNKSIINMVLC